MPRENKKRGRRAEAQAQKRKYEDGEAEPDTKRQKVDEVDDAQPAYEPLTTEYYGMLDSNEQDYFRTAHETLEQNQFEDAEARQAFLDNLHQELMGKELKLACSQSWSRLLEKLVQLSSPDQLQNIFARFQSHFTQLVQHRFASHVCETLFTAAAPSLSQPGTNVLQDGSTAHTSNMEARFLHVVDELESDLGFLLTDKFASHTLRVLIVVLAGLPLDPPGHQSVIRSKRKEVVDVSGYMPPDIMYTKRPVPDACHEALRRLVDKSTLSLNTNSIKTLAMHPVGNPTLQTLLRVDLLVLGKSQATHSTSLIHRLLPDEELSEGSETASFLNGLVYDAIGSRLLETMVECVPGKLFKILYRQYFKERLASLARNEIAGYVVCRILERLGPEDLKAAAQSLQPLIPQLMERGRFGVVKTLLERLSVRKVDIAPLIQTVSDSVSDDKGQFSLAILLQLPSKEDEADADSGLRLPDASKQQIHAAALVQAMMAAPGKPAELIFQALSDLNFPPTVDLARSPVYSRILQNALNAPHAPIIMRRKLVTRLQASIASLATDPCGSHLIDATWAGTNGMAFLRERIAEELAEDEDRLRESIYGRKVWRSWRMDLYKRRRGEWVRQIRREAGNDGFLSFPDGDDERLTKGRSSSGSTRAAAPRSGARNGKSGKTALQLARERFAKKAKVGLNGDAVPVKIVSKKRKSSPSAL